MIEVENSFKAFLLNYLEEKEMTLVSKTIHLIQLIEKDNKIIFEITCTYPGLLIGFQGRDINKMHEEMLDFFDGYFGRDIQGRELEIKLKEFNPFALKNIKKMNTDLEKLDDLLRKHDWTYQMSDDNRCYQSGVKSKDEIKNLLDKADKEGWKKEALDVFEKRKNRIASLNDNNYIVMNFYGS